MFKNKEMSKKYEQTSAKVGKALHIGGVSSSAKCSHFWKMVTKNYYKCGWCDKKHYR